MDTPEGVSFKYSETGKRIRLRLKQELVSDKRNVLRIGGFSRFCHPDQGEAAWRDLRTEWLHSRWEMHRSLDFVSLRPG